MGRVHDCVPIQSDSGESDESCCLFFGSFLWTSKEMNNVELNQTVKFTWTLEIIELRIESRLVIDKDLISRSQ